MTRILLRRWWLLGLRSCLFSGILHLDLRLSLPAKRLSIEEHFEAYCLRHQNHRYSFAAPTRHRPSGLHYFSFTAISLVYNYFSFTTISRLQPFLVYISKGNQHQQHFPRHDASRKTAHRAINISCQLTCITSSSFQLVRILYCTALYCTALHCDTPASPSTRQAITGPSSSTWTPRSACQG